MSSLGRIYVDLLALVLSFIIVFQNREKIIDFVKTIDFAKTIGFIKRKDDGKMNWIPLTKRPVDKNDERERDFEFAYDCLLPEDEEQVLVSSNGKVFVDMFCMEYGGGCYFETVDDPDAWMPLPKPYEKEDE